MKSTKLAAAALLGAASVLAVAWSANAADGDYTGWYGDIGAGWNKVEQSQVNAATTLRWKDGYGVLGGFGYRFGQSFRVEGELGYRANDLKSATGVVNPGGNVTNFSQMLNALFDFPVAPDITLSAGFGIGGVRDNYRVTGSQGTIVDNGNYSFGYQAIGGASFNVAPQLQAYVEYHYLDATGTSVTGVNGTTYRPGDKNHLVMVGLRYFFGQPPAPPPPPVAQPAPPPPPPPPPPAAPVPKNYLVFFDFDKSDVTPEAHKIIVSAVESAKKTGALKITVTGHTDTVGTAKYNQALSVRRANAVKAELQKMGYSDKEIAVVGKGFTQPLVPTGPQVREPQNRRAEIVLQ